MTKKEIQSDVEDYILHYLTSHTRTEWEGRSYNSSSHNSVIVTALNYNITITFVFNNYDEEDIDVNNMSFRTYRFSTPYNGPNTLTVDELYNLIDVLNKLCTNTHYVDFSVYFNSNISIEITNFMQLFSIVNYSENGGADKSLVIKVDDAIKKGTLSVVNLALMDKIDKKYRDTLKSRNCFIDNNVAILFDNA